MLKTVLAKAVAAVGNEASKVEDWLTGHGYLVPAEHSPGYRRLAYAFAEDAAAVLEIRARVTPGNSSEVSSKL